MQKNCEVKDALRQTSVFLIGESLESCSRREKGAGPEVTAAFLGGKQLRGKFGSCFEAVALVCYESF